MKRKVMTIHDVAEQFEKLAEQAVKDKSIRKPISWALYHTWKWADANEEETGETV